MELGEHRCAEWRGTGLPAGDTAGRTRRTAAPATAGVRRRGLTCPNCGHEQPGWRECNRCGVVFRKLRRRVDRASSPPARVPGDVAAPRELRTSFRRRKAAVVFCASLITLVASAAARDRLPPTGQLLPELQQSPVQDPVEAKPFEVVVGEHRYSVVPRYRYELWGLVVSCHDANAWWDIYHHPRWKDAINVKDLCVVWGANLADGAYRSLDFRSDPGACYVSARDPAAWARFHSDQLSNNHLLVAGEGLSRRVMAVREGDQVYFRGYLADYKSSDWQGYQKTSAVRTDTGNGACETVYLEDLRVLKRANPGWRWLFWAAWVGLSAGAVGWLVLAWKPGLQT